MTEKHAVMLLLKEILWILATCIIPLKYMQKSGTLWPFFKANHDCFFTSYVCFEHELNTCGSAGHDVNWN